MARQPEMFGTLPPGSWPVEMGVYLLAMTPQDWVTVITALCGSGVTAAVGKKLYDRWEASSAKKLLALQSACDEQKEKAAKDLAALRLKAQDCEEYLQAQIAERAEKRKELLADIDRRQEIIDKLRDELKVTYKTIDDRDATIRVLLVTIDNLNQTNHMLGRDLDGLAKAHLMSISVLKAKNT